ncbi:O-antigen ligase family protein [Chitinophagaceae bacterium MMS25-I14]
MQQPAVFAQDKWFRLVSTFIVLAGISAFAYTGKIYFLLIPFGFLFTVLLFANWKLAYWLLLFCIPFSFDIELVSGSLSTSLPDEPMMWIMLLLFAVLLAANPRILPKWWWKNPLVMIIVIQYLWLLVAVIFSHNLLLSVKFTAAKTWFLVSFFLFPVLVFRSKKDFKTAFLVVLVPLLITMLIIVYRHRQLNFDFKEIQHAIGDLYYNHVDYSTVMSMFFPLLCVAVPMSKGMNPWWRILLVLIIIFFLPAIYLTYARAAMIAVFFALAVAVAVRFKLANLVMPVIFALVIWGISLLAGHNKYLDYHPNYERTYMRHTFSDHILATFRGQDMSSMERVYRWIAAVRMSKDQPVTGYGPNNFYYYYKPYAVSSYRTYVSRNDEHSTTHNYFIYMLVEQGWPAMILYAILVMAVLYQGQKVYHRFKDRFYKWCTMGIIMMFAAGFINNFFSELLETHKVGALFYIGIALLVVLDHKSRQEAAGEAIQ